MPYFPTYEEMQEALDSARLKMWHEHGKTVDFGGPEFVLYVMEGLGKMEAPKILDEPLEDSGSSGPEAPASEGEADAKVTVTKSFGVEGAVREEVQGDAEEDVPEDEVVAESHPFRANRSGKRCIDCRQPRDEHPE